MRFECREGLCLEAGCLGVVQESPASARVVSHLLSGVAGGGAGAEEASMGVGTARAWHVRAAVHGMLHDARWPMAMQPVSPSASSSLTTGPSGLPGCSGGGTSVSASESESSKLMIVVWTGSMRGRRVERRL